MTLSEDEIKAKDRRASRIIGFAFFLALVMIPPLNKYVLFPRANWIIGAPESMLTYVLGGLIGGSFFGGAIWLLGRSLNKHRRTGQTQ
jgi:hypothetical protein